MMCSDKRQYVEQLMDQAEETATKNKLKILCKFDKTLNNKFSNDVTIKNREGNAISFEACQLEGEFSVHSE